MTAKVTKESPINLNSVLLMIVTGLSAWTLHTVFDISVAAAASAVKIDNHERTLANLDSRMTNSEQLINQLYSRRGMQSLTPHSP